MGHPGVVRSGFADWLPGGGVGMTHPEGFWVAESEGNIWCLRQSGAHLRRGETAPKMGHPGVFGLGLRTGLPGGGVGMTHPEGFWVAESEGNIWCLRQSGAHLRRDETAPKMGHPDGWSRRTRRRDEEGGGSGAAGDEGGAGGIGGREAECLLVEAAGGGEVPDGEVGGGAVVGEGHGGF